MSYHLLLLKIENHILGNRYWDKQVFSVKIRINFAGRWTVSYQRHQIFSLVWTLGFPFVFLLRESPCLVAFLVLIHCYYTGVLVWRMPRGAFWDVLSPGLFHELYLENTSFPGFLPLPLGALLICSIVAFSPITVDFPLGWGRKAGFYWVDFLSPGREVVPTGE